MVVALNKSWKLPIAHFFTDSVNGQGKELLTLKLFSPKILFSFFWGGDKPPPPPLTLSNSSISLFIIFALLSCFSDLANLISLAIENLNESGIIVTNLTCDNAASNISALTILGARISCLNDLKVTLNQKNCLGEPIYVILDTCHLMKLVRGTIHDMGILYNSEGKKIRWSYFEALLKIQTEDGLHLGNKVKKDHVFYLKQKMQVNLVTQLLSDSVADAIQFCDEHLHRPEFSNSSATSEFIRIFNALFDVLNSRTIFGKYSKAPMKTTNVKYWKQIFDKAKN